MKALLSTAPGGPETLVLQESPALEPGPGEVVIAVKAAAVNFPDVLMIQDLYQTKPPRPFSPGGEVAGVVKAVGEGVKHLASGDRVAALTMWGGMAEEARAPAVAAFKTPDNMPHDEAAAILLTYGTSIYALKERGRLRAGETLLVLGAAGGVGISAIELGKAMGARVIAAASSQEKVDFARQAGADDGLVYPRDIGKDGQKAFSDAIKSVSGGGVDVIYDAVGGDYSEPALRAINWDGRFLVIGFAAGIARIPLNLALLKSCEIVGVFWGSWTKREPERHARDVAELLALYEAGKIKPRVSQRFPLARGGEALQALADRSAQGKIVVTI